MKGLEFLKNKNKKEHSAHEALTADTKHVAIASIEEKQEKGEGLTQEDLHFLYAVDINIEESRRDKDDRIQKVLESRDIKRDLASIFRCRENQISLTKEEALQGDIVYHYGDLNLRDLTTAEDLTFPKQIGGNLDLSGITTAEGLALPDKIEGDLNLFNLTTAEELTLPSQVGGRLELYNLTTVKGHLTLPALIGGGLSLGGRGLQTMEKVQMPERLEGSIDLGGLTTAKGLSLPGKVTGYLNLWKLTTPEDLRLPNVVEGNINLDSLTTVEGLAFPDQVKGYIILYAISKEEKDALRKQRPDLDIR